MKISLPQAETPCQKGEVCPLSGTATAWKECVICASV